VPSVRRKWFPALGAKRDQARHDRKMRARAALLAKPVKNLCASCKTDILRPATPEESWFPCCSAACHQAWTVELDRRDEVAAARRLGVPVAEYRKAKAA